MYIYLPFQIKATYKEHFEAFFNAVIYTTIDLILPLHQRVYSTVYSVLFECLWNPLLHRILAGLSSSGKLGGPEVKTSALVSRRLWVRIPPESPVKFFPQIHGKH